MAQSLSLYEAGKWSFYVNRDMSYIGVHKAIYNNTRIAIEVNSGIHDDSNENEAINNDFKIGWILRQTECWNEFVFLDSEKQSYFSAYYKHPDLSLANIQGNESASFL
jgi:hypothetical protein